MIISPKLFWIWVFAFGIFAAATFEVAAAAQPAPKPNEAFTVSIAGAVNSPGLYQVGDRDYTMSLWHLLYRANGLKDMASDFVITRSHEGGRRSTVILRMPVPIGPKSYGFPWVMQRDDVTFVQTYSDKTLAQMWGGRATTPAIPYPDPDFISHPLGQRSAEPNWSEYGDYLQVMIYAAEFHWKHLAKGSKAKPLPGSSVTVKFILTSDGEILGAPKVTASDDHAFPGRCVDALHASVPYAKWPEGMERILGKQQELTFKFWNQTYGVWIMAALGSSL